MIWSCCRSRSPPVSDLFPRALVIGIDHERPLYDSVYITTAKRFAGSLITVDVEQEQTAASADVTLKSIVDFSPSA